MLYRFYTPEPLTKASTILLSKQEWHHAKKVMRMEDGDRVEFVNGRGELAKGSFGKSVLIEEVFTKQPLTETKTLIIAKPETKHLEWVLEKATEIGIDQFIVFPGARSKKKELSSSKKERLQNILIAAMKQCKRLFLPKVTFVNSVEEITINGSLLLADPSGECHVPISKGNASIVVGPESGLTQEEKTYWIEKRGAICLSLGSHVLRCETAAILSAYEIMKV